MQNRHLYFQGIALLFAGALALIGASGAPGTWQVEAAGQELAASGDSFVDINNPDDNYDCSGASTGGLELLYSNFPGFAATRDVYLQFDLSSVASPAELSTLSVYIAQNVLPASASVNLALYAVSDDSWGEDALTYNNQPASGTWTLMETISVTASANGELLFDHPDVGTYIENERLGDQTASFLLRLQGGTDLEFGGGIVLEDRESCQTPGAGDEPAIDLLSNTPAGQTIYLPIIRKEAP